MLDHTLYTAQQNNLHRDTMDCFEKYIPLVSYTFLVIYKLEIRLKIAIHTLYSTKYTASSSQVAQLSTIGDCLDKVLQMQ